MPDITVALTSINGTNVNVSEASGGTLTIGSGSTVAVSVASAPAPVTKADVGLGNVDNTSDASKPVSTATQTALDGKAASSHTHGSVTADGKIGSTSGQIVVTTTAGALTTAATISAGSVSGLPVSGTGSGNYCSGNDSRLSDARTPLTHTHAAADIVGGIIATASLASGTASSSNYLRGDQTWASVASYTLPAATTSTLGGVIVGAGLSVTSGTVSANVSSVAGRTGTVTLSHSDVGNAPATLTQFTASQNNVALDAGGIVRVSANAAVNITGFVATSGGDARLISNVGTYAITLKHSDAASTAANRILCVENADVVIAAGGSAVVYYDATDSRWRVG